MTKKPDWIQTYTGRRFWPLEPDADDIVIEDIAHALAMQCRYSGHTVLFYSVAQHSVLLERHFFSDPMWRLAALLHDAAEAYLSDIPRPLKQMSEFNFYQDAEDVLSAMIMSKFGVDVSAAGWHAIMAADREMLTHEASEPQIITGNADWNLVEMTIDPIRIKPWLPDAVEHAFLKDFAVLTELITNS